MHPGIDFRGAKGDPVHVTADGDVISLKDGRDHLIGSAIYNSRSQIVARRFSRRKQNLDLDFFSRRIAQAAEYRQRRTTGEGFGDYCTRVGPEHVRALVADGPGQPLKEE